MSREVQVRFCESRGVRFPPATHRLVLCRDAGQAQQVKQQLQRRLEPRGLAFNQAKTKIVHLDGGVDPLLYHPPLRRQADHQAHR